MKFDSNFGIGMTESQKPQQSLSIQTPMQYVIQPPFPFQFPYSVQPSILPATSPSYYWPNMTLMSSQLLPGNLFQQQQMSQDQSKRTFATQNSKLQPNNMTSSVSTSKKSSQINNSNGNSTASSNCADNEENDKKRKRDAWAWDHFGSKDKNTKERQCNYCQKKEIYPTNAASHLIRHHLDKIKTHENIEGLDNELSQEELLKKAKNLLEKFVIHTGIPFLEMEDEYLQEFVETAQKLKCKFEIPNRKWFSEQLSLKRAVVEEKIKKILESIDFVSLTIDNWTNKSRRKFLGLTVHYLDKKWNCISHVLKIEKLNIKTGEDEVATVLKSTQALIIQIPKVISEYGIYDKTVSATTDSGPDIKAAFERLKLPLIWVPCFDHRIQRAFEETFN